MSGLNWKKPLASSVAVLTKRRRRSVNAMAINVLSDDTANDVAEPISYSL